METQKNEQAKFAFFYLISLVALVFMAIGTGAIIFQIINKYIPDALNQYGDAYSDEAIKFGIASLLIAAPIFYFTTWQIVKSLYKGILDKDSGIRKWLTYLILFICSVEVIGYLIGVLFSFLDGELTLKFALKALTAVGISAIIFAYYLYDIKREEVINKKDIVVKSFFYLTILAVIAVFAVSIFTVESPQQARQRRVDDQIIERFQNIDSANMDYYNENDRLADSLDELLSSAVYLEIDDLENPVTGAKFEYKKNNDKSFELCTDFQISTLDDSDSRYRYYDKEFMHDSGYQCIKISNKMLEKGELVPRAVNP